MNFENMNEAETPVAESQISKQGCTVVAYHESVQCYFRPGTEELVFIADCQAGEFETHWRDMMIRMDEFHQAKANYSSVLEHYARAAAEAALSPPDAENHHKAVTTAESELEKTRAALHSKLGDFSQQGMSYDEVVELIPVVGQAKAKRGSKPTRYAYVKKGYFSKSQDGRKLHTVSLKGSDKKGGGKSIYSKDKNGRTRIDTQKLAEQLTDLKWPTLKLELKDVLQWTGSDFDLDELKKDCVLFEWAEKWNDSLYGKTELGANVDVSGAAQFMRFVSNVGASAEFDPNKGQASFKGEAKANLSLASATVNLTGYIPDRLGWSLSYTNTKGHVFDMGMLRLFVAPELSGFIGASVLIEGQLQVVLKGDQQMLAGQSGGRLPRFRERRTRGAVFHQQMAAEDEGLRLSGEAFAGARAEGSFKGGLQWLKPAPPVDPNASLAGILKSSGEFTEFCSIGGNIAGLAGAGAGGKFHCTFINGKFCFHVAASLCWGVGAKSGVICEVGTNTIVEFGAWLIYQLYRLDYSFFDMVEKGNFEVYSQYCVMQVESIGSDIYEGFRGLETNVKSVAIEFSKFIKDVADENKKSLEASRRRNQLAENINALPERLLRHTPEAKGILLYLLTRHGTWDLLDPGNRGNGLIPDIYQQRKEAVMWVLKSIQTRAEWRKVLCRMTPDGVSMSQDDNEFAVAEQQEKYLVSFLQLGFNRDQELYKEKSELAVIYDRLKTEVAWGYALTMNDTFYYQLNTGSNTHYPQRCNFGPCNAESRHLA
ncbi:hypothetical protein NVV94_11660 [Pseudomonas sp. LS1212]|uniref:hypothetical protein n=1 Tax=Pseudomonas sp. LS1212 TaxID=2972478 RepID=UPI00215C40F1|nr:hypothetical protein [Pseudomonas sp. LS1212]UVJ46133.1 hypothetical protein NVV94_11660 [Pseudomonas sp. LS1212]